MCLISCRSLFIQLNWIQFGSIWTRRCHVLTASPSNLQDLFCGVQVLIALTEAGLIDLAQLPAKALGPTALLPTALAVEAVRPQAGGKLQSPNCHRGFLWNNLKFKVSTVRGLHGLCDYVNVDPHRSMMNHVMQEVYSWFLCLQSPRCLKPQLLHLEGLPSHSQPDGYRPQVHPSATRPRAIRDFERWNQCNTRLALQE